MISRLKSDECLYIATNQQLAKKMKQLMIADCDECGPTNSPGQSTD